jgi:sialic acid synthase SpsE
MEPDEFKEMVRDVNNARLICGQASYDLTPKEIAGKKVRRSIFAANDIKSGETFTSENIKIVRPGNGEHPRFWNEFLGKTANRNIEFGEPVFLRDIASPRAR